MDDLAKAMASGQSRRGVLRRLLVGIFGVGAVTLTPKRAEARSEVAACIQTECAGLTGLARAACVVQCVLGVHNNSTGF
jgi:hypothetical protein